MKARTLGSLVFIFVLALAMLGYTGAMKGMREGATTIADNIPYEQQDIVDAGIVEGIDFTDQEWQLWMDGTAFYDVDVNINSNHAFVKHGSDVVNAALRCVNEKGTTAVISEKSTRNLHLLCVDGMDEYVVIITQIKKAVDRLSNAKSTLVTAFKLRSTIDVNIGAYIQRIVVEKGYGVIVRLAFRAGEVFFSPY